MKELGVLFHSRDINFNALDRQLMCFPHVVNICCQHVIQKCTDIALADAPEQIQVAAHVGEPQSREDTVKRDPIARGRNVVHVIRSSGQRQDAFTAMIKSRNEQGWF
jgi:hypothetical protein